MPRAALTINDVTITGVVDTLAASETDGESISNIGSNAGRVWLEVNNGGGGSINVTVKTPGLAAGLEIAEQIIAVAAGVRKKIGPFPQPAIYNQTDGSVHIDYSAVTSVTSAAFRLP